MIVLQFGGCVSLESRPEAADPWWRPWVVVGRPEELATEIVAAVEEVPPWRVERRDEAEGILWLHCPCALLGGYDLVVRLYPLDAERTKVRLWLRSRTGLGLPDHARAKFTALWRRVRARWRAMGFRVLAPPFPDEGS